MTESQNAVRLCTILRAPPERIYKALLCPDALAKWYPPNGFTGRVDEMDARVGGGYRMTFVNLGTGRSHSFRGEYRELKPNELIRVSDRFDDPNIPGKMQTTIALSAVSCGTRVEVVQEGLPSAIQPEHCRLGWQESLSLLALLVEAEIRDGG